LHTLAQAGPEFTQFPVGSQVWGCSARHWVAFGTHDPVQLPALHAKEHGATRFCHNPVGSQVWG
jgi:hypothetical protein